MGEGVVTNPGGVFVFIIRAPHAFQARAYSALRASKGINVFLISML